MEHPTGRLLVVDDDENNRDMLSRRLRGDGYVVDTAADGSAALRAVAGQVFDLVLLDIEMPGMNGFEVLAEVRKTRPATQLPVVIATARNDRRDIIAALELGANDFVTKPIDFPVVRARVRTQLSHKFAVDRIVSLEENLRKRNVELEQTNARMSKSLELASRMQHALLPAGPLRVPGVNFAWLYQPCDELGGDILNVFPLGPGHVGFYLLDVSGHGLPAALLSVTLSRMLAAVPGQASLVQETTTDGLAPRSPASVVAELNHRFQMSAEYQQYFTLFYAVLDVETHTLRYVTAGHPPALFLSAAGDRRFLPETNFAVGWFDDATFEESQMQLSPGDRLYLYSDGCTETLNDDCRQFGAEGLLSAVDDLRAAALQPSLGLLHERLNRFRGCAPVKDDLSALSVEIARP